MADDRNEHLPYNYLVGNVISPLEDLLAEAEERVAESRRAYEQALCVPGTSAQILSSLKTALDEKMIIMTNLKVANQALGGINDRFGDMRLGEENAGLIEDESSTKSNMIVDNDSFSAPTCKYLSFVNLFIISFYNSLVSHVFVVANL